MADCHEILGEYSFCKMGNNKINKALFTSWAVVLTNAEYNIDILKKGVKELRHLYQNCLSENTDFYRAITSSTGTRKNILISIEVVRDLWEKCYDKID